MNLFFETLYFIIIALSFSVMWNFSEIFRPIRNFVSRIPYVRRPLMCPECSSFWFGFFSSFLYNPIILNFDYILLSNIICGLIVHFFAFFIFRKKNIDNNSNYIKL
jgi:hypothetical protein